VTTNIRSRALLKSELSPCRGVSADGRESRLPTPISRPPAQSGAGFSRPKLTAEVSRLTNKSEVMRMIENLITRSKTRYWSSQSFSTMSRPRTPSSEAPVEFGERFHDIDAPTEWIEDYRPGGLHPIHLGDTLDRDRYKILRKLGYGSFSTVWLARDAQSVISLYFWKASTSHISFRESRYVAIKVSVSRASEMKCELRIFEHLAPHRDDRGAGSVMELLRSFEHEGPNGRHLCLVFPVMGPCASTLQMKFSTHWMQPERFPLWIAKSMLKQLLLGLSFLHRNGVTHTGVYHNMS
jgi:hypothetical protein